MIYTALHASMICQACGLDKRIGVFTSGEDTLSLRLTSELVDLRSGYANPVHCDFVASTVVRSDYSSAKRKKKRPSGDDRQE